MTTKMTRLHPAPTVIIDLLERIEDLQERISRLELIAIQDARSERLKEMKERQSSEQFIQEIDRLMARVKS